MVKCEPLIGHRLAGPHTRVHRRRVESASLQHRWQPTGPPRCCGEMCMRGHPQHQPLWPLLPPTCSWLLKRRAIMPAMAATPPMSSIPSRSSSCRSTLAAALTSASLFTSRPHRAAVSLVEALGGWSAAQRSAQRAHQQQAHQQRLIRWVQEGQAQGGSEGAGLRGGRPGKTPTRFEALQGLQLLRGRHNAQCGRVVCEGEGCPGWCMSLPGSRDAETAPVADSSAFPYVRTPFTRWGASLPPALPASSSASSMPATSTT